MMKIQFFRYCARHNNGKNSMKLRAISLNFSVVAQRIANSKIP